MNTEHNPTPWCEGAVNQGGPCWIEDAQGVRVAFVQDDEQRARIVSAVNAADLEECGGCGGGGLCMCATCLGQIEAERDALAEALRYTLTLLDMNLVLDPNLDGDREAARELDAARATLARVERGEGWATQTREQWPRWPA